MFKEGRNSSWGQEIKKYKLVLFKLAKGNTLGPESLKKAVDGGFLHLPCLRRFTSPWVAISAVIWVARTMLILFLSKPLS